MDVRVLFNFFNKNCDLNMKNTCKVVDTLRALHFCVFILQCGQKENGHYCLIFTVKVPVYFIFLFSVHRVTKQDVLLC